MFQVKEKSVVSEETHILTKLDMLHYSCSGGSQSISNFSLLPGREENITSNAHNEHRMFSQRSQAQYKILGWIRGVLCRD